MDGVVNGTEWWTQKRVERIGIHFLKDPGFRALVGLRDPFDDLCCDPTYNWPCEKTGDRKFNPTCVTTSDNEGNRRQLQFQKSEVR